MTAQEKEAVTALLDVYYESFEEDGYYTSWAQSNVDKEHGEIGYVYRMIILLEELCGYERRSN